MVSHSQPGLELDLEVGREVKVRPGRKGRSSCAAAPPAGIQILRLAGRQQQSKRPPGHNR